MRLTDLEVKEIFFKLEANKELLSYQIDGVSIYYMLRFPIEMYLRASNSKELPVKKKSIVEKVFSKLKRNISKGEKLENVDSYFDQTEQMGASAFLFVGTCAWRNSEGSNVDLYDIIKYYHEKGNVINFIQPRYDRRPFPTKSKYYHSFLPLEIKAKARLQEKEKEVVLSFLRRLSTMLKIDFQAKRESYIANVNQIFNQAEQLANYIKLSKAKLVFARSVYTEPWVAIACSIAKVKLVEVQHGVVGENNIYYQSSLGNEGIKQKFILMPDYILTIGNAWKDILLNQNSYFNKENVFNIGVSEYSGIVQSNDAIPKRLLFLLQGRGLNGLLSIPEFITQFLDKYKDQLKTLNIDVVVRPHPNDMEEASDFKKHYPNHVVVEDSRKVESITSIKKSDYTVSATSMCLYEAMAYSKQAISFSEFEGMTANPQNITFVNNAEELFSIIENQKSELVKPIAYLDSFNGEVLDFFNKEIDR